VGAVGVLAYVQGHHGVLRYLADRTDWARLVGTAFLRPRIIPGHHSLDGKKPGRRKVCPRGVDVVEHLDAVCSELQGHFQDAVPVLFRVAC
jgi:hypothetical protein